MKKILYLIPSVVNSGGMERVLAQKANYLASIDGISVTIMTTEMKDSQKTFFSFSPKIKFVHLNLNFELVSKKKIINWIFEYKIRLKKYNKLLSQFIINENIDYCISLGGKELEFFYKMNTPCKKLFECHFNIHQRSDFIKSHFGNSLFWKLIGFYRDKKMVIQTRGLDNVIVLTEQALNDWKKTHNNIVQIPNPLSFETSKLADTINKNRIIAIGRLEHQKGYDLLIQAWALINKKYPEWHIDIYGSGSLATELSTIIKNQKIDNIKFQGITNDVKTELLNSAFIVLSSRFEGLPMILLESISCGLPIVSFDCETGPSEIIKNDDCGFLVQNGNIELFSKKMEKLILNPMIREKMGRVGKEKSTKYSLEKIMSLWLALFHVNNN